MRRNGKAAARRGGGGARLLRWCITAITRSMLARFITFIVALLAIILVCDADLQLYVLTTVFGVPGVGTYANKVVWITGASSGIGEHLAYKFAATNATLVLSARREDRLRDIMDRCRTLGAASNSIIEPLDVAAAIPEMSTVVDRVLARVHHLDVLVLNAGATQRALAADMSISKVKQLFELNVFAAFEHARVALPHLSKSSGSIVVTSSFTGKIGTPVSTAYSASKHALHGFFGGMRAEVPEIDISLVCFGPVESEIAQAAGVNEDNSNKMPTGRATELMLSAIHHKLFEVWISPHPPLLFLYVGQYFPSLVAWLNIKGPGRSRVEAFKKGIDLYSSAAYTTGASK